MTPWLIYRSSPRSTVSLKDSDGQQVFSAPATVRAGSNTKCVVACAPSDSCHEPFLILVASTRISLRIRERPLPIPQSRRRLFRTPLHRSDPFTSTTKVEPGVAAATSSGGPESSHGPPASAGPSSPATPSPTNPPKPSAASASGSSKPPSQSPGVKANSAGLGRDTSSALIGVMIAVGLLSVAVFLVD